MIFEHEIPNGSRLYFGNKAKAKRELEYKASTYLLENGFEEITTPLFSYSQYQSIDDEKELITLKDNTNHTLAIRADSTLDVVRIITKRLGRTTEHKKWFYIQPVFSYPSNETYQIGVEWIEYDNVSDVINLNCNLLSSLNIDAMVQISNIKIALIISKEFNIDINLFKNGEIGTLFSLNIDWLTKLIEVQEIKDLENILDILPEVLKDEAKKLIDIVNKVKYKNITLSPIYYSKMKYYDNIYYRVLNDKTTIARGGGYKSNGVNSLGFALYTDNLLKVMEK